MKKIALGAALLLLSSAAYAQTSVDTNANTASKPSSGTSATSQSSGSNMMLHKRSGGQDQMKTETTGSTRSQDSGSQTSIRTRQEGGARVGIGVESHERPGVSVRSRTVHEVNEPSVSVTRRRSVTTYNEPDTEIHRTIVKTKHGAKKVAVKKKKPSSKVVMRKKTRYHVVQEPVEVRRSRTVHRYEVDEPSVSVQRRTTVHQTRDVSPRVGVSVEQRGGTSVNSRDVNVSTSRQRSSSPETTGTISNRSRTDMTTGGASGNASHSGSGTSTKVPMKQQGGSSSGGSNSAQ